MILQKRNGLAFFQFPSLASFPDINHGIFSRKGGVSRAPFDSLNTALSVGDSGTAVLENRRKVEQCMGGGPLFFPRQVHGTQIIILKNGGPQTKGGGFPMTGDAVVTDDPGLSIVIQVADCQPVLLFDPSRLVIANIHSGWRGSIRNIIGCTVDAMCTEFGCNAGDIHAGIGPSLGPCCGEFIHYRDEIPESLWGFKNESHYFDFWKISQNQLVDAGVMLENITVGGLCTQCRTDLFFSYRKEKNTGRFAAVIGLNSD